ncbi:MAG TPA: DoxX family protein [Candidatus Baltobacteraceae bacterium]|nr:DoxX family protein [Candidatus Baltobacteraceae bacterium]
MISRSILLLPRLYLGVIFLAAVYSKFTIPVGFARALTGFLNSVAMQSASPAYKAILQAVVLPHAGFFAGLVELGELFVGIALLLGLVTRFAAAVAIFLLANYFLAKGLPLWSPASNDMADIVLSIVVMTGAAGRVFGLDKYLAARYPNVALW